MADRSRRQRGTAEPGAGRRDTSRSPQSSRRSGGFDSSMLNGRMGVIFLLFCAAALVLGSRLVWLQFIDAQNILDRGTSRDVTVEIQPRRGTIYDRNGTILATTVDAYNVFCHPHMVTSDKVDQLASALVDAFGGEAQDYKDKIQSDANFAYLYKGADEEGLQKIRDLGIEGVDFEKTTKRVYPCGATASQVIGLLNSDGEALTGLELYYDDILGGTPGEKTTEYSAEGVPVPGTEHVTAEVVDGQDIVVSIDVEMQQTLEESLAVRVDAVEGKGGSAVLMDSATGEIYACSSWPTFDVTDTSKIEEGATNLSCISSAYEPGSVVKPITMLAALEEGVVTLDSTYHCPAALKVGEYTITDSHERGDEDMTVSTIIGNSSNVGISLVAKDLTFSKLADAMARYGVTDKTGVDYPGESSGWISSVDEWSTVQGYNISFGQGFTTTPIEMVRFYAALANDGVARQPHFLLDVPAEDQDRSYASTTITENVGAIDDLETMMAQTVESGTGADAQIDGYTVVGKTGTAEIASESGGYQKGVYNISFVGYLPDSSTNLVCFVGATEVPGERQTVQSFRDIMTFAIDRYNITQEQ